MTCTLSNSVINKYISFHVTEQSKYFFRLRVIIQQSINTVFFSKIKMIFIREKIILMSKIRFDELLNGRKWNLYNGYIGIKDESAWIRFFFSIRIDDQKDLTFIVKSGILRGILGVDYCIVSYRIILSYLYFYAINNA